MFRKALLLATMLLVTLVFVSPTTAYEVPNKIVITRPGNNKPLNDWITKVTFPHGFHAIRVPCKSCHHKETDKTLGQFVGCRQCHQDEDPTEANGFYRAWHSPGPPSCLGCHTQMRTNGGKNPIGCTTACHKPS